MPRLTSAEDLSFLPFFPFCLCLFTLRCPGRLHESWQTVENNGVTDVAKTFPIHDFEQDQGFEIAMATYWQLAESPEHANDLFTESQTLV